MTVAGNAVTQSMIDAGNKNRFCPNDKGCDSGDVLSSYSNAEDIKTYWLATPILLGVFAFLAVVGLVACDKHLGAHRRL